MCGCVSACVCVPSCVCLYMARDANHMHLLVTFYENVLLCLDSMRRCSLRILPGGCCCRLCLSCACCAARTAATLARSLHTHTRLQAATIDKYLHVSCRFLPMLFTIKISRKLHILLGLCCTATPTRSGQHGQRIVAKIFALHARTHTLTHTHMLTHSYCILI